LAPLHSIHFGQQLVDQPFSCLVTGVTSAARSQRIHFIEKQDAGVRSTCPCEQLPHRPLALTHVFIQQLRAFDGDEVGAGFCCCGFGHQGFAATRGAVEEDAGG
jgi:hypothetical protein